MPNDHVTLVRNDNYWHKANIDEWVHKVYPNQDALDRGAQSRRSRHGPVRSERRPGHAERQHGQQVSKYLNLGYTYIGWNQLRGGKEFLQDKAVRQALAYGLERRPGGGQGPVRRGGQDGRPHAAGVVGVRHAGLNDYKYDPAKAEQVLQQDGWAKGSDGIYAKDGQKLEFSIVTNSGNKIRETFIQVAAEQYKQIGMNVEPKTESFEALVDRINTSKDPKYGDQGGHDFDAVVIGWALIAGSRTCTRSGTPTRPTPSENNFIQYKNPDLDKAIDDSRAHCAPGRSQGGHSKRPTRSSTTSSRTTSASPRTSCSA